MRGADDEQHVAFAIQEGRALFTQDVDFLRLHPEGRSHAGIVYAPQGSGIGSIVSGLMLIHEVLEPNDMLDHVEFL
jgi:hypothetical protein